MAVEELTASPETTCFVQVDEPGEVGLPHRPVYVFRIPFWFGSTFIVEPSTQRSPLSLADKAHQ
jgi:hypothetical protein